MQKPGVSTKITTKYLPFRAAKHLKTIAPSSTKILLLGLIAEKAKYRQAMSMNLLVIMFLEIPKAIAKFMINLAQRSSKNF
jgi:hypothetical protein